MANSPLSSEARRSNKLLPLEALRGMGALIVVAHHFIQCFLPAYDGTVPPYDPQRAFLGSPWYLMFNGTGAVIVFFMLSGYVLSLHGLRPNASPVILDMAVKRWFRLAPQVCMAVLLPYALFILHLQFYDDAAHFNNSYYLRHFTYDDLPQSFHPSLFAALSEGLFRTFLYGDSTFNSNLWTMRSEFYGSFFVFAIALTLHWRAAKLLLVYAPFYCLMLYFSDAALAFLPFLLGVALVKMNERPMRPAPALTLLMLALGTYLCAYYEPIGAYAWLAHAQVDGLVLRISVLSMGAFLLLMVFATDNIVSRRFQGPLSYWLGRISFPLYLLHAPVLTSASAWTFARFHGSDLGIFLAFYMLCIVCIPLIWAMCRFERWWLGILRRWHPFARHREQVYG